MFGIVFTVISTSKEIKMLDTDTQPLSQTLNLVVEMMAEHIDYVTSDVAPSTYRELVDHMDSGKKLVIYDGGSDFTIFGEPSANHAFRAWHDTIHYQYGYDFSTTGEMFTCNQHISDIITHFGVDIAQECAPILLAEVIGQSLYYRKYKAYVGDQRAFAIAYMKCPRTALLQRW
jgi:hypothetical protein